MDGKTGRFQNFFGAKQITECTNALVLARLVAPNKTEYNGTH